MERPPICIRRKTCPQKCSYHFTWYNFDSSGQPHLRLGTFGGEVSLTTPDGDTNLIKHLSANDPYKTLGSRQNPAADPTQSLDVITAKSNSYATLTVTAPINQAQSLDLIHLDIRSERLLFPTPSHLHERTM
jgi:hypothetical protein